MQPILVVDDDRDTADILALLLRLWDFDAVAAYDGPTALKVARASAPPLALIDLAMPPPMSGLNLAERMRAEPDLDATILVAVSGFGRDEDRKRSRDAGFALHLMKPTDPQVLRDLLDMMHITAHPPRKEVRRWAV